MNMLQTTKEPRSRVQHALRAAFVALLVRRMKLSGVMKALLSASFSGIANQVPPPHPRAYGVHATLKPLCRSGVAAGGAGGGGPGYSYLLHETVINSAATDFPLAA